MQWNTTQELEVNTTDTSVGFRKIFVLIKQILTESITDRL